jgi:hypothetical protein
MIFQRSTFRLEWMEAANLTDQFGDAELREVCAGGMLTKLRIRSARLTDDGIQGLSQMPLWILTLECPTITDEGLKVLAPNDSLSLVEISSDRVTGSFLESLDQVPGIHELRLTGRNVDDRACRAAARFAAIADIDLADTQVTDAGLAMLIDHKPSLKMLDVRHTRVTAAGVAAVQQDLPDLVVYSDHQ